MRVLSPFVRRARAASRRAQRAAVAARYLRGRGIEVGALHNPLPLPPWARARYVDRMTVDGLREHYPELRRERLVQVDVVDDGERLATFADGSVDFVVANHFLEHCEDPIGALLHHLRVLRPGGALYLAVPDKRGSFDAARETTTLEHLVRDHEDGPAASRGPHYLEWARLVVGLAGDDASREAERLLAMRYSIHFHVFTPGSLLDLLLWVRTRSPFDFEIVLRHADEVVAVLRKEPGPAS